MEGLYTEAAAMFCEHSKMSERLQAWEQWNNATKCFLKMNIDLIF